MTNKMERFTQRARRILSLAQEIAETRKHPMIDTEHLLYALVQEEGGIAGRVLRVLGVDLERVAKVFDFSEYKAQETPQRIDLSTNLKKSLELAVLRARSMGHHYIGTEHLLLGLINVENTAVIRFLDSEGITIEAIKEQTRKTLQESPTNIPTDNDTTSEVMNTKQLHIQVSDAQTQTVTGEFALPLNLVSTLIKNLTPQMLRSNEPQTLHIDIDGKTYDITISRINEEDAPTAKDEDDET